MTKKQKEILEVSQSDFEMFKKGIEDYCHSYSLAKASMGEQKSIKGILNFEELTQIFGDFNSRKQNLIMTYMNTPVKENIVYKKYLKDLFSDPILGQKRIIGEIIAGIENNLIINS